MYWRFYRVNKFALIDCRETSVNVWAGVLFNKCFLTIIFLLTIRIPQNLPPKSRKWHLRDSRFKHFPGENAPGTPYNARAYSARLFPFSCARECHLLRRLVLALCLRQSHLAHVSLAERTFLACNILVKVAAQNLWRAKHELSSMGRYLVEIRLFTSKQTEV
jgi:hypothetical protein